MAADFINELLTQDTSDRRALTVPIHFSKTVPKGTLRAIIRQA
jgi:predicted RNA binding protein YcfA (HicA-like mRNA interferase family)